MSEYCHMEIHPDKPVAQCQYSVEAQRMAAANRDLSPELGTGIRFSGAAHNLEAFVTEQPRVNVLWELEDSESQENSYASGHTDWCPAVCCREVKHVSAFVELLRCLC